LPPCGLGGVAPVSMQCSPPGGACTETAPIAPKPGLVPQVKYPYGLRAPTSHDPAPTPALPVCTAMPGPIRGVLPQHAVGISLAARLSLGRALHGNHRPHTENAARHRGHTPRLFEWARRRRQP